MSKLCVPGQPSFQRTCVDFFIANFHRLPIDVMMHHGTKKFSRGLIKVQLLIHNNTADGLPRRALHELCLGAFNFELVLGQDSREILVNLLCCFLGQCDIGRDCDVISVNRQIQFLVVAILFDFRTKCMCHDDVTHLRRRDTTLGKEVFIRHQFSSQVCIILGKYSDFLKDFCNLSHTNRREEVLDIYGYNEGLADMALGHVNNAFALFKRIQIRGYVNVVQNPREEHVLNDTNGLTRYVQISISATALRYARYRVQLGLDLG